MSILRVISGFLCVVVAVSCAGCAAFLPERSSPPQGELPEQFTLGNVGVADRNPWWHDFGSEELDALVQEALVENLTLRQLWARLDQAGCTAIQAASGLYPELTLDADASYRRAVTTVENGGSPSLGSQLGDAVVSGITDNIRQGFGGSETGGTGDTSGSWLSGLTTGSGQTSTSGSSSSRLTQETKSFGLSLAASYEVDIWGRIASGYRAAQLDMEASRDDLESTAITLSAEIVDRWLRILEQRALERILRDQLQTNQTYLKLVELRFRQAQVSALDVYQQRQTVREVERQIPLVQAQEQVLLHDLAVLLGKPPASSLELGDYDLSKVPSPPATGIPADLLMNRPDVRAALARLHAADHRVAAARADRLPAIRLSGGVGYNATDISNVFDDWFVNLASGLTAPLFDGFRRRAEVDRTLAVVEERLADYRLVVLTAIKEVEDALVQETKQREYLEALGQQLAEANSALEEASQRYRKGLNTYLPVLDALERTQLLTREQMIARRELLVYRVTLYRSLGGTWTRELAAPSRISEVGPLAEVTNNE